MLVSSCINGSSIDEHTCRQNSHLLIAMCITKLAVPVVLFVTETDQAKDVYVVVVKDVEVTQIYEGSLGTPPLGVVASASVRLDWSRRHTLRNPLSSVPAESFAKVPSV